MMMRRPTRIRITGKRTVKRMMAFIFGVLCLLSLSYYYLMELVFGNGSGSGNGGSEQLQSLFLSSPPSSATSPPSSPSAAEEKESSPSSSSSKQQQQLQQQQQQQPPSPSSSPSRTRQSKLLPLPLDLYRQNKSYPLNITNITKANTTTSAAAAAQDNNCSCTHSRNNNNATTTITNNNNIYCCRRYLHTMHKMGYVLSSLRELGLRKYYKTQQIVRSTLWHKLSINKKWTTDPRYDAMDFRSYKDFKDAFLFRNLYDSLVSGYLYHKSGRECWLTMQGKEIGRDRLRNQKWYKRLSYPLRTADSHTGQPRSFCRYMADENELDGMRAYVDLVFRYNYKDGLIRWSILNHHYFNDNNNNHNSQLQQLPSVAKNNKQHHLHVVCFEDLMSDRRDAEIQKLHNFFFFGNTTSRNNNSSSMGQEAESSSSTIIQGDNANNNSNNTISTLSYKGGHTTEQSQNTVLKQHLIQVIKSIDEQYYNGDIEWLNSIWPC